MPPAQKTRIEDLRVQPPPPRPMAVDPSRRFRSIAAGVGSEVLISFRPVHWLPQRVSWMARIAAFEWNSHFIDEQVRGPFQKFRHHHGLSVEARQGQEGTFITDSIEYEAPLGKLGSLVDRLIRMQLKRSFAYRQERLPGILALAARQAVQRH